MKYAVYSGLKKKVAKEGMEKAIENIANMGFSSIEIFENLSREQQWLVPDVESAKEVKKLLDKHGLTVACYSVSACLWKNELVETSMKKTLDIASELGSPFLHHTLIPWLKTNEDSPTYEAAIAEVLPRAERIANYAATLGITCLYEEQGKYFNGVVGFGRFYEAMKKRCGNIGVCGDFGNIYFAGETSEMFFEAFAPEIKHIHIKDYLYQESDESPGAEWLLAEEGKWLKDTEVGNGIVNFDACMKILKAVGYAGICALEIELEPWEEILLQTVKYLERIG